jgi:hypothetical protein
MNKYIEIQIQSPAEGATFVAQWYAGGQDSGQAFALSNVGELLSSLSSPRRRWSSLMMRCAPCYATTAILYSALLPNCAQTGGDSC